MLGRDKKYEDSDQSYYDEENFPEDEKEEDDYISDSDYGETPEFDDDL